MRLAIGLFLDGGIGCIIYQVRPDSQVVRRGSAKPLCAGSIPAQASKVSMVTVRIADEHLSKEGQEAMERDEVRNMLEGVFEIKDKDLEDTMEEFGKSVKGGVVSWDDIKTKLLEELREVQEASSEPA